MAPKPPDSDLSQFFDKRPKTRFLPKAKKTYKKPALNLYEDENYRKDTLIFQTTFPNETFDPTF